MLKLFGIGFIGAAIAGLFALYQVRKVFSFSEGNDRNQGGDKNLAGGGGFHDDAPSVASGQLLSGLQ